MDRTRSSYVSTNCHNQSPINRESSRSRTILPYRQVSLFLVPPTNCAPRRIFNQSCLLFFCLVCHETQRTRWFRSSGCCRRFPPPPPLPPLPPNLFRLLPQLLSHK